MPRLGDEDRARMVEFLQKVSAEAEELVKELEARHAEEVAGHG